MKKRPLPKISIIISNLNGMSLNLLSDCLDSLTKPGYPNWELFVVDNNSSDESVNYLKKRFQKLSNCRVIQNPINMYSQGLNLGAKASTGKYLAYFNNDVAVPKNYFNELVSEMEKDSKLAIVQGKLVNYFDHKFIDSAGESMDIYGNPVTIGSKEKDNGQFNKVEEILSASGSACLIRRDVFEKLGGYDPDYGIGYEDMDLALRARRLGFTVKRFPKAVCYHKRASTDLAEFIRIKVKWHFNKNRLTTMFKNYPLGLLFKTIPVTLILYFGITFWEWFINKKWNLGWVRLSSIFWVIGNFGNIVSKRNKINKMGAVAISKRELELFSPKSVTSLFREFRGIK